MMKGDLRPWARKRAGPDGDSGMSSRVHIAWPQVSSSAVVFCPSVEARPDGIRVQMIYSNHSLTLAWSDAVHCQNRFRTLCGSSQSDLRAA